MLNKEHRIYTNAFAKKHARSSESLLIICVPACAYKWVLHNLKRKMEIAAAMLTFLLNYTNESIRSVCICGSASQNSEMELFHAWAGRFRESCLNCRVHTDSKMLTRYGQKNAIAFFSLYCFSQTHSCARKRLEFGRPVLFHLFKVI